jgi:hypothetical protein
VPNAQTMVAGNSNNGSPFGCDHRTRDQQVYRGSEIASGTVVITQVAFRLAPDQPAMDRNDYRLTVTLSSTKRDRVR